MVNKFDRHGSMDPSMTRFTTVDAAVTPNNNLEDGLEEGFDDWADDPVLLDARDSYGNEQGVEDFEENQRIWEEMEKNPLKLPSHKEALAVLNSLGGSDFGAMQYVSQEMQKHPEKMPELMAAMADPKSERKVVKEIWNKEYIQGFSDYLAIQVIKHGATKEKPLVILEVGAGDGRLSNFMKESLERTIPGLFQIVATDLGKDNIGAQFEVEQSGFDEALAKYQPEIVLSSWMPQNLDFTKAIRATPTVKEYILIGEPEVCGSGSDTWGSTTPGKNKQDGFQRTDLENLHKLQVCRNDDKDNLERGIPSKSITASFVREA